MRKAVRVLLCVIICLPALAQVNLSLKPYLQSPTPTSIKVLWRTDTTSTSKVMYGTAAGNLTQSVTDTALVKRHNMLLSGLSPYTKYYYAVYAGNTLLEGGDEQHSFRTFPVAGTELPFRVWGIGDFGKANAGQAKVRDSYLNFDTTETNLWLWLGDNAYNDGTEAEYLAKVFDTTAGYGNIMTHMPFEPAPGNHDYNSISPVTNPKPPLQHTGPYYDFFEVYKNAEAGGIATGHELFYSFDYGNAHFISLNSELGSLFNASDDWTGVNLFSTFNGSPQTQWLTQDLQANTKPWVIAYFHQPPYTDGSHESTTWYEVYMKAMRQHYAPILEQYGVDIVLCGHTHVYERSYLVKGCFCDPQDITPFNILQSTSGNDSIGEAYIKYTQGTHANEGTVYVNNGNSGSSEGDVGFNHPFMYAEFGCDTCYGSFIMDINGNRLDGRHLDGYGNLRDHFTIYKVNSTGIEKLSADGIFNNLQVQPNPFKNGTTLTFSLNNTEYVKIELVDLTGRQYSLFAGNLGAGPHNYSINAETLHLAKGMYMLRLTAEGKSSTRQVIKID